MNRISLVVVAAAMLCFACAPVQSSLQSPSAGERPHKSLTCDSSAFQNKIHYLNTAFAPSPGASPPPMNVAFPPGSPAYVGDLGGAYCAASPEFQQALGMLDAVYINGAPCAGTAFSCSWGWRQSQPAATTPGGRVIALSTLLWNERSYSQYETELFQSVLPLPDAKYSKAQSCSPPTQNFENCSSVDTPTMALLAALAHEVGHVRWYDLVDTSFPSLNYPISYLCQGGVDFFDISWQTRGKPPAGNHGGEWRGLLVPSDQGRYAWKHLNPPQINAIDNAGQDKAKQVAKLFAPDTLHSEGEPWATALSAMAPDEDFIETYKFKVLISANKPLTSVNLAIPTATTTNYDIPLEYFTGYRSDLFAKVQCIASF